MKTNTITMITCSYHVVGETILVGRHGGAYVTRYIVVNISGGETTLERVEGE